MFEVFDSKATKTIVYKIIISTPKSSIPKQRMIKKKKISNHSPVRRNDGADKNSHSRVIVTSVKSIIFN